MTAARTLGTLPTIARTRGARRRILLALHLLVAFLAVIVGNLPFPQPDARWQISSARFQIEGTFHPGVRDVTLPHNWLTREPDGTAGFYRIPVDPTAMNHGRENIAVFIPRFTARVDVLANGRRIASSGGAPGIETVVRNTGVFATVPPEIWQPGGNLVEVRVETRGILSGFLDRLYIGPESALKPAFERRTAIFIQFPAALAVFSLLLAGILLIHWLRHDEASGYAVLALSLLFGTIHAFNLLPSSPLYSEAIHRALHVMPVLEAPLTAIAVALMLGHRFGHPLVYLLPGAVLFLFGLFGNFKLFTIGMVAIGLPMIGFFLGLIIWLGASITINEGSRAGLMISLAGSATLLLWLHDLFVVTNVIADSRIVLARLLYPLLTGILGTALVIWLNLPPRTSERAEARPASRTPPSSPSGHEKAAGDGGF